MANPYSYYLRTEVSNSDLTELKNYLYPRTQYGDKEKAFKFGTLVDALITENERVHYSKRMVDDVTYSREDFELGLAMREALRKEARKDEDVYKRQFEYSSYILTTISPASPSLYV